MYGACHINGTWSNEVGWLKLYDSGKPQRGGTSFFFCGGRGRGGGEVDPSRRHALKKKNLSFPGYFTSLY